MLKVGILGMGHIGKKHLQAIDSVNGVELEGTADVAFVPDAPKFSGNYQSLLDNEDIDIISVCTPNALHAEQSIQAIKAQKHVICEKPFALNKSDCESVIDASLHSGKFVFCVMQNRFSPVSQWLKEVLSENRLGEILLVNVACYWNRDERYYKAEGWKGDIDMDGGTLFTQFAHYVDTLYYLFGNVNILDAHFENYTHKELIDFEDSGMFSFKFKNGAMGTFQYSTSVWNKNLESTMTIIGSKGSIKVGGQYMDQILHCHAESVTLPELPSNDNINNLASIYRNARDVIGGQNKLMTNAMDGMRVVDIIERVYQFKK